MNDQKTDITIIGAGLTGLTLAYYLKKRRKKVLLVEKNDHAGGVIQSRQEAGFCFETGPNTGTISTPELVSLFDDLGDSVELETANPRAKNRWILKNGRWHALPSGPRSAITTPLFSMKDKFRILGEPFRRPGTNTGETVAELVKRRLGKSFLEYAVDPFISGIYAGDPHQLVTRYALPKLYHLEQEYGSFIKGAMKKRKLPKTELEQRTTREVFSVKGGLQNLVNALEKEISEDTVFTNCNKVKVEKNETGYVTTFEQEEQGKIQSEMIVSTIGGHGLNRVFPFISAALMQQLQNARYARVVQAIVGYKHWRGMPLEAFGGLIPSKEDRQVLGILFPSSIFTDRAPAGGALVSVFLGGIKNPGILEKSDEEIRQIVMNEVASTLEASGQPDLFRIYRYQHAIPQYEQNTGERLKAIRKVQEEYPGLILAGNIHDGIGMADRIKQARNVADQITGK